MNGGTAAPFDVFKDEFDEGKWVAEKIEELVKSGKYKPKDFMVLYRVNSQSRALELALSEKNIAYHIEGGVSFYDRKEIKDILSYLKLAIDTSNDMAWDRIFNVPNRYLGKVFNDEVTAYAKKHNCSKYHAMLNFPRRNEFRYKTGINLFQYAIEELQRTDGQFTVSSMITRLRQILRYDDYIQNELDTNFNTMKLDNLTSLTDQASRYEYIEDFLQSIRSAIANGEDMQKNKKKDNCNKVQMKSMHCSKGEESPVVFVVGFSEGLIPHSKSPNIEAERLLGYVALSRAEEEMYVSSILSYNSRELEVSDFLYSCFDIDMVMEKVQMCTNTINLG